MPGFPDSLTELARLGELLRIEEQEELRLFRERVLLRPLEKRIKEGTTWFPAKVATQSYGTGDSMMLELEALGNRGPDIFQGGQIVNIFPEPVNGSEKLLAIHGVVAKVQLTKLVIALNEDELPDWLWSHRLGVDQSYDDRSYREMERALRDIASTEDERLIELREILHGHAPARFRAASATPPVIPSSLNASQQKAIEQALLAKDAFFILGPPGTGKTTTLVQAIRLAVRSERQTLVCAPSNTAVDLLAERLADAGLQVVRVGHPARVSDALQQLTLDYQITRHYDYGEIRRLKQRAEQTLNKASRFRGGNFQERRQYNQLKKEARYLQRDASKLESYILQDVLAGAEVIVTTLTGAASQWVRKKTYHTVFLDEACQALEPACWIPIRLARRVIFAGDPFQLPPTVKSAEAAKGGLELSLAEKFYRRQQDPELVPPSAMLTVQYRMHRQIMGFSNQQFYGGRLVADSTVIERGMPFPGVLPVLFIDTAGSGYEEVLNEETLSRGNPGEVQIIHQYLRWLTGEMHNYLDQDERIPGFNMGVIAPYQDQVRRLRITLEQDFDLRHERLNLDVRTIDGFQGQERDVILLSLVRSNQKGEIGFLRETRRINVALTRAKRHLVIVGDSATIGQHPFYKDLLQYVEEAGGYQHLWSLAPTLQMVLS